MDEDDPDTSDDSTGDSAYFTVAADGSFLPTKAAGGHWGESILSGPAVAGLAAWSLERAFGEVGFLPARFTINLMRPARKEPLQVTTRELRRGRRARYADCEIRQGEDLVATAVVVLYQRSQAPEGQQWSPIVDPSRKRAYYRGLDVVEGEPATPFVRAVVVAEATTNMVVNLGTDGIGYINGGLTVLLYRTPRGEGLGVQGDRQFAADGVAIGSTTLFDDEGPVGIASITALANPAAKIDFTGTARNDAPGAELYAGGEG
ncbi:MAG: thioesterase family protein [Mycobacteriaceae bacterium]|nr:thioesterase family protein [Mycobacteriaceae bacterium]